MVSFRVISCESYNFIRLNVVPLAMYPSLNLLGSTISFVLLSLH